MTDKKPNEGVYIVLRALDADPITPTVQSMGAFTAPNAEHALKQATGTENTGRFVVVPSRNWKMFDVQPVTTVQVKAVE